MTEEPAPEKPTAKPGGAYCPKCGKFFEDLVEFVGHEFNCQEYTAGPKENPFPTSSSWHDYKTDWMSMFAYCPACGQKTVSCDLSNLRPELHEIYQSNIAHHCNERWVLGACSIYRAVTGILSEEILRNLGPEYSDLIDKIRARYGMKEEYRSAFDEDMAEDKAARKASKARSAISKAKDKASKPKSKKKEKTCRDKYGGCKYVADTYPLIAGGTVIRCGADKPCRSDVWHENDPDIREKIKKYVKPEAVPEAIKYLDALKACVREHVVKALEERPDISVAQLQRHIGFYEENELQQALDELVQTRDVLVEKPEGRGFVARYRINPDDLGARILKLVREGVDNYRDLGVALARDKFTLKPTVRQLVQDGSLRWKEGAYGRLEIPPKTLEMPVSAPRSKKSGDRGPSLADEIVELVSNGKNTIAAVKAELSNGVYRESQVKKWVEKLVKEGRLEHDGTPIIGYYKVKDDASPQEEKSRDMVLYCEACGLKFEGLEAILEHEARAHSNTTKAAVDKQSWTYCIYCGKKKRKFDASKHDNRKHVKEIKLLNDLLVERINTVGVSDGFHRWGIGVGGIVVAGTCMYCGKVVARSGFGQIEGYGTGGYDEMGDEVCHLDCWFKFKDEAEKARTEMCASCGQHDDKTGGCAVCGGCEPSLVLDHKNGYQCAQHILKEVGEEKPMPPTKRQKKPVKQPCEICGKPVLWESKDPRKVGGGFGGPKFKPGDHYIHDLCSQAFHGLEWKIARGEAQPPTPEEIEKAIIEKARFDREQREKIPWKNKAVGQVVGMCGCGMGFELKLNEKGEVWCDDCGPIYIPDPRQSPKHPDGKGWILCTPEVSLSCWHYHPEDNRAPCDSKGPCYSHDGIWGYYCGCYAPRLPAASKTEPVDIDGPGREIKKKPAVKPVYCEDGGLCFKCGRPVHITSNMDDPLHGGMDGNAEVSYHPDCLDEHMASLPPLEKPVMCKYDGRYECEHPVDILQSCPPHCPWACDNYPPSEKWKHTEDHLNEHFAARAGSPGPTIGKTYLDFKEKSPVPRSKDHVITIGDPVDGVRSENGDCCDYCDNERRGKCQKDPDKSTIMVPSNEHQLACYEPIHGAKLVGQPDTIAQAVILLRNWPDWPILFWYDLESVTEDDVKRWMKEKPIVKAPPIEQAKAKAKQGKESAEGAPEVKPVSPVTVKPRPVKSEKPCKSCSNYCDEPVTWNSLDEPKVKPTVKLPAGQATLDMFDGRQKRLAEA